MPYPKHDGRGKHPNSFGTRIKRGEVRNPKGRPSGATGYRADLQRELKRQITITENGHSRRISALSYAYRTIIVQAAKNVKYMELLVRVVNREELQQTIDSHTARRSSQRKHFGLGGLGDDDLAELYKMHGLDKEI